MQIGQTCFFYNLRVEPIVIIIINFDEDKATISLVPSNVVVPLTNEHLSLFISVANNQ